jgi:phospholipid/cholesterol/gamma-HCH transport system substrate-binding protein
VSLSSRQLPLVALALAGVVVLVLLVSGGSSYMVRVQLANADGLRTGSQVKVGGVPVGSVASLRLGAGDAVQAGLKLNSGHNVTSDATAAIVPSDLLGSMYVQLTPGAGTREPSGATIPASRVTYPVQLDQVLNVLDANTRARLGILIDEAGTALTGRGLDFNRLLALLPQDFRDGTQLLSQVVSDNHTLAQLIGHADSFIATLTPQRNELTALIRAAGQTMTTTAARQAALKRIFALAPGTLASAQRFLAELRQTALPLAPAARAITLAAPRLTATLDQLPAFQRAAQPALATATQAAPLLTRLGVQGAPVIEAAEPTGRELADFAQNSDSFSTAIGASIDNALGLIEGWARSIQTSDNIGHVFHGRALVGAEFVRSLLGSALTTLNTPNRRRAAHHAAGNRPSPSPFPSPSPSATAPGSTGQHPVLGAVGSLLGGLGQKLQGGVGQALGSLGLTGHAGSTGATGSNGPAQLAALLGYLLKR